MMEKQFEVLSLFPVPLYVGKLDREVTRPEMDFILGTEYEHTNTGGNLVSKDRRILDAAPLADLKRLIEGHIDAYRKAVLATENELYITQSWTNRNGRGTSHHAHYHSNSVLSGTVYFTIDPSVPPIVFKSDRRNAIQFDQKQQNIFTADTFAFSPRASVVVLFPSSVEHYVPVNDSDLPRVSLAFNTFVRGELGIEPMLTRLSIR
jgi:uncharacterized protein (TIGR02466 family)